ncbi:BA75_00432T0 [Komagataella pastoris]|uniref:BA75_00432T0 n=1 Tax=Komagataella pastoris TaxID=4922 RepID=A0A1B2J725_PICPA|nr:BA75_00432T0 [Komagataella pastoris]
MDSILMDKEDSLLTPVKKFETLNLSSAQRGRKPLYPSLEGFPDTHESPNRIQHHLSLSMGFDTDKSLESMFPKRLNKSVLEELNNRTEKIKGSLSYRQKLQGSSLKSSTLKEKSRFSSAHSSIFNKMESIKDHCAAQRLERRVFEQPDQDGGRHSLLQTATKRRRTLRGPQEIREPLKETNSLRTSSKSYNLNEILHKPSEGTRPNARDPPIPKSRSRLQLKNGSSGAAASGKKEAPASSVRRIPSGIVRAQPGDFGCPRLGPTNGNSSATRNTRLQEKKTETVAKPTTNTPMSQRHVIGLPKAHTNRKVEQDSTVPARTDSIKSIPRSVSSKGIERSSKTAMQTLGSLPRSRTMHNDLNLKSSLEKPTSTSSRKTRPAWR